MPLSKSILHPRPVASLYLRVLREIPRTIVTFDLPLSEREVRERVRFLFEKHNARGKDGRPLPLPRAVLDRLLYDGEQRTRRVSPPRSRATDAPARRRRGRARPVAAEDALGPAAGAEGHGGPGARPAQRLTRRSRTFSKHAVSSS